MSDQENPSFYDYPGSLLELGLLNIQQGRHETAWHLAQKIIAERPDDAELIAIARRILAKSVDEFHHPMLQDRQRNTLYHEAIKNAAPGKIVLDIGTGSGLLAMMAARAGAKHVIACEENPIIALAAQQIVEANGLQDKITIHNLRSDALDRDSHVMGGAELVISEIFSLNLIGEGVLPSLEHARTQLCAPGAMFLPDKASIRVALARFPYSLTQIGEVEGFDLSPFNQLTAPFDIVPADHGQLELASEPEDLFEFEFAAGKELAFNREAELTLSSSGGTIDGFAQWLQIDFGDGLVYENAPGGTRDLHWPLQFIPLPKPLETTSGVAISLHGRHTRNLLMLWADN